jgi:hypothetical protein
LLADFAIVPDLCNLTGGGRRLQGLGVEAEEGGGQLLQRLEFLGRDVRLLVLGKAVDEEAVSADLEQDDRPKAAGFAAAFAGDPGATALAASSSSAPPKFALRANFENSLVL